MKINLKFLVFVTASYIETIFVIVVVDAKQHQRVVIVVSPVPKYHILFMQTPFPIH